MNFKKELRTSQIIIQATESSSESPMIFIQKISLISVMFGLEASNEIIFILGLEMFIQNRQLVKKSSCDVNLSVSLIDLRFCKDILN